MRNHSRPPLGSVVEGRYIVLVQKTSNLYLSDAGSSHLVDLLDNASAVAIDDKVPLFTRRGREKAACCPQLRQIRGVRVWPRTRRRATTLESATTQVSHTPRRPRCTRLGPCLEGRVNGP